MIIIIIIVAGVAMVVANYMWQRERNRREELHDRRMERYNKLLEILKKTKSDSDSSTTKDEKP